MKGIVRAGLKGIISGHFSEGASTLTQQLIKNNVFPNFVNEDTFFDRVERKLQEQYLALEIEKQMTKSKILENYLNTINLGQNTLGVQAASKRYFGKDVSELTLSECATIAAITQNPGKYNPVTNPDKNAERREKVLNDMKEQGYINQTQYDEALADPVYERIQATNAQYEDSTSVSSYFIDAVADEVIEDLVNEMGYTETQAYNAVYSGGLSIITTQNVEMQKICEEELSDDSNYPSNILSGERPVHTPKLPPSSTYFRIASRFFSGIPIPPIPRVPSTSAKIYLIAISLLLPLFFPVSSICAICVTLSFRYFTRTARNRIRT